VSALSIRGVTARYGSTEVLHALDLDVPSGSTTSILGPSGSGKTTLLRVIAGFEPAAAGSVTIGDRCVEGAGRSVPPEKRRIGYVAQDGALFPHLTVAKNVAFGLRRSPSRADRVAELLDMVGLDAFAGRYPHELSGGQQQRVALARALASRPQVVLLDEPFAALDAALRQDVRREVGAILREAGTTVVLVTHDQDEALSFADRVAVLRAGVIVQVGEPAELYDRPVDVELAEFLGAANIVPGVGFSYGVKTALGELRTDPAVPAGVGVLVLVRPEQVRLTDGPPNATVGALDYHGHDVLITVTTDAGATVLVRTPPRSSLAVGARLALEVRGHCHAWPS